VVAIAQGSKLNFNLNLKFGDFKTLFDFSENLMDTFGTGNFQNIIVNSFMNESLENLEVSKLQQNCFELISGI
jgi:hypothetical protein